MSFDLSIGFVTQAGVKSTNEDFAALLEGQGRQADRGVIAAIADGVSAGGMGAEAAQTSVNTLLNDYFATPSTWDTTVALDRIISAHNSWLSAINKRRAPLFGLTTLTALVLRGQTYTVAHIGDTRAYLVRAGKVQCLTHDHVMPHIDFSHQLTRCIGLEDRLMVDYMQGELHTKDLFILLSDGVHGKLSLKDIEALVGGKLGAQELSAQLVATALKKGSQDNLTALVVDIKGVIESTLLDESRRATELPVLRHLKTGERIDGLVVTALVADSGVYKIYQMRDPVTQKLYALKTLHPQRAHDLEERLTLAHEAWVAKRMQSGMAAKQLAQLNVWPKTGEDGASHFYLLYDWHCGETLEQIIKSAKRIEISQIVYWMNEATKTLGFLHRQGVVHRDVKPANLHWGDDGVLRLLDLGVALSGREPESTRLLHAGSPSFMNPEQWPGYLNNQDSQGALPDAKSDLFALGVTLYQLLSRGKLPYGEILPYQFGRYMRDPLPPSRHNPEVPIWLDLIALKAVSRVQSQRFETGEELVLALERGASRPLSSQTNGSLAQRNPLYFWRLCLGVSLLANVVLFYWLLFLPSH